MSTHDRTTARQSVEVEYWVIDGDGRLVEPGALVEEASGVEREFVEPLLEIKTTPCRSTTALREELFDRLVRVLERAEELDKGLVPLATPLVGEEIEELPSDRTKVQNEVVGEAFEYVRHCAGTHIHVEQRPGRVVDQFNTLVALDPALALVNSSPYFDGRRLAAGARSMLYRRMAYEDLPHQGWLWSYIDDTDEWTRRLERRHEEFVRAAVEAGVDRQTVEAGFDEESAVWTPVQLRDQFDTVEWRSPDATLPSHVVRLADDLTDLIDRLDRVDVRIDGDEGGVTDDEIVLPEFDAVVGYVDAAIEDGLESGTVRSYLDRLGFDVGAYDPISPAIDGSEELSPDAARELRLDYADRLKRDVRRQVRSIQGD
ncbi:glutamate-cysteine ligase family protein [Halobium salinum]|uniref:Glutamate-cysteine ligase family protein n=1 Tax=Halobium salinum TaxID=1364940 RepID=A0ABD5PB02_9EURY|nr:glutamate-cysteine ligase family protein [Halobium salinum]